MTATIAEHPPRSDLLIPLLRDEASATHYDALHLDVRLLPAPISRGGIKWLAVAHLATPSEDGHITCHVMLGGVDSATGRWAVMESDPDAAILATVEVPDSVAALCDPPVHWETANNHHAMNWGLVILTPPVAANHKDMP